MERENRRNAVGVLAPEADGGWMLGFSAVVDVAIGDVAAVEVCAILVVVEGGSVVVTAGGCDGTLLPAPLAARCFLSPAESEHSIDPIFTGSWENLAPGNTLLKLSPSGWVPAWSRKHWQEI